MDEKEIKAEEKLEEKEEEFESVIEDSTEDVEFDDDGYNTSLLDVVVNSREDAEKIIGACCIVAISYRGEAEDTEEIKVLRAKIADMQEKIKKYIEEHSVKTFSAKNIGCKKCGSSLAKEYLKSDICPLCGNDLRGQTTIDGENAMKQKLEAMEAQLSDLVRVNKVLNGKIETLTFNEEE